MVYERNEEEKPQRGEDQNHNLLIRGALKLCVAGFGTVASTKIKNRTLRKTAYAVSAIVLFDGALVALTAYAQRKLSIIAAPEIRKRAVVDGVLMQWEDHGDQSEEALPIIFVHGIPSHPRAWRYIIPQVARPGVRCLAWELVGFGWSIEAGLNRDISPAQQALYLKKWLLYMNINRAIFVGHDVGGGAIQGLLVEEPECAIGLILSDAIAYDNWPVPMVRTCRALADTIEYLPAFLVKPFYLAALLNLGHDHVLNLLDSALIHWQPYKHTEAGKGLAQQGRHANNNDTLRIAKQLPRLAQSSFPKIVIWGTRDPLGMDSAKRLAKDIDAHLQWISGGRHFTLENHPEKIAKEINGMIAVVSRSKDADVTNVNYDKNVKKGSL